jgi:hypothetical protein
MMNPSRARALRAVLQPEILVRAFLKKFSLGSLELRLAFGAFDRPWYAQGMYEAARLAQRLKHGGVSVIEFGVAQADGLAAMEAVAAEIRRRLQIEVQIFGFDSGEGLPGHGDYRDLPYVWRRGLYKMDVEAVRRRLPTARLILGDVSQTAPRFLENGGFPPIGFISFDLDYYTSTLAAFQIFDGPDRNYLPRVLTYFDDIISGDQVYFCEEVGELRAIREFNQNSKSDRIRPIHGWKQSLLFQPGWADAMWAYHRFDHYQYNEYIGRPRAMRPRSKAE